MQAAAKLKLVSTIVLVGFVAAVCFHALLNYWQVPYPLNTFLCDPSQRFQDFLNPYYGIAPLNPYFIATPGVYFPWSYLVIYVFTFMPVTVALAVYMITFCGFLLWFLNYFLNSIRDSVGRLYYLPSLMILTFLSFPVLFCLDRGNFESLLFIFLALFVVAFQQKKYLSAAICLALASAMKLFPLVFVVLLLKKKRFYEAAFCIFLMIALSLVAFASFQGGMLANMQKLLSILHRYNLAYSVNDMGLFFSNSLFALIKVVLKYLYVLALQSDKSFRYALETLLPIYTFCMLAEFCAIAWFICFKEQRLWKKVMLLVCVIILFPNVSPDYRLIYLFLPFLLFVMSDYHDQNDKLYTILFALLLIPKNYFLVPDMNGYSIANVINILILLFFMARIMKEGFQFARRRAAEIVNKQPEST